MADAVSLYAAKTHLSSLVDRAEAGEEIIIAKSGTPRARLVPLARTPRHPGGWDTGLWIADDFDAPLPLDIIAGFTTGGEPMPVRGSRRGGHAKGAPRAKRKKKGA